MLPEGFHHASPAGGQACIKMAATRFDDHVAALEFRVFMYPVPGMGQLVTGTQTRKRCVFGMQMNGGVQQGQLLQGFADHSQQHFRFHVDRLADNLSSYLNAQGQQIVGYRLIELRDASLKILQGLRQKQGLLAPCGLRKRLPGGIAGLMPLLPCLFANLVSLVVADRGQSWFGRSGDGRLDRRIEAGKFPALPRGKR